ncbi:Casein kinase II subunit beta' [Morella rubra]|uniref:Casein kinase II subunit beta n=1 Tax=Morella rubra TaxID=262757 RepID=A0A6A1VRW9_9ROSI|nr:Casein kinase II subunit beta' [Morella rubra]
MYRERGVGGSRPEVGPVADRKQRINEALDKQLERSSPSTSRAIMNGKDKVFMGKAAPDQRDSLAKSNFSDDMRGCIGKINLCLMGGISMLVSECAFVLLPPYLGTQIILKEASSFQAARLILFLWFIGVPYLYGFGLHASLQPRSSKFADLHLIHFVEESETDSEESDVSGSDGDDTSWIQWFCNLRGNEFFCEVDDDYIQDDFNLCGLSGQVPYYDYALDLILDVESSHGDMFTEEQNELVESAAEMLYGLIHARYILTSKGMAAMLEKYKIYDFGRCPRVYCCGQPCLPVGQSDIPRSSTVKIYCPRCEDIYYPRSKYQDIDGAYFGTTFPHLFLMTYGHLKPQKASQSYVPRVFGFKTQ